MKIFDDAEALSIAIIVEEEGLEFYTTLYEEC